MSDVQILVQQYKVQFTKASEKLIKTYNNAPQKLEALRQSASDLQPTVQSWISSIQDTLKNQITDMAPVGVDMAFHKQILSLYTLVAVGLFASTVGHLVGGTLLSFLVGMFFSTNYALMVSLIVLPMATFYYVRKNDMPNEDRSTAVIASSFASGAFLGYVLSERYLTISSPPMFVMPLTIGLSHIFFGPSLGPQPRSTILGASIGAGIGLSFVFGLFTGSLGGTFFMWALLLGGTAFLDYQIKLARMYEGSATMTADAVISIATYMATGFALTMMLSSSSSPED